MQAAEIFRTYFPDQVVIHCPQQVFRQRRHPLRENAQCGIVFLRFRVEFFRRPFKPAEHKAHTIVRCVPSKSFPSRIGIKKTSVRHAQELPAGVERIDSRKRRGKISMGIVHDQIREVRGVFRNLLRQLAVVVNQVQPLVVSWPRHALRAQVLPDGIAAHAHTVC